MTNCFEIVSSRLFVAKMGVDGSVSGGTSEVLAISEGDVLTIRGLVTLGETEVNDVDGVLCLIVTTYEEVVGFDVTMNDALFVHNLDPLNHLHSDM